MGTHSSPNPPSHHQPQRHPQRDQSGTHRDPYEAQEKAPGIEVCETCALVHHAGRWYAGAPPLGDVRQTTCPACRRVRDRAPAGRVRVHGIPAALFDEIRGIVRNAEARERAEHPLERLMEVSVEGREMRVTTTGAHLARVIGEALGRRFRDEAQVRSFEESGELRVEVSA